MRVIFGNNNEKLKNTHGVFEYIWTHTNGQPLDGLSSEEEIQRIKLEDAAITDINEMLLEGNIDGNIDLYDNFRDKNPSYTCVWSKIDI